MEGRVRLATDSGGTITDLVYLDENTGEVGLAKASFTLPARPPVTPSKRVTSLD